MFIKINNDEVVVKGLGCVDVRNHQNCLPKEDTTSPTVSAEGLMMSCMIDTTEGRDVATADTPVSFLQTDYDKGDVNIKM